MQLLALNDPISYLALFCTVLCCATETTNTTETAKTNTTETAKTNATETAKTKTTATAKMKTTDGKTKKTKDSTTEKDKEGKETTDNTTNKDDKKEEEERSAGLYVGIAVGAVVLLLMSAVIYSKLKPKTPPQVAVAESKRGTAESDPSASELRTTESKRGTAESDPSASELRTTDSATDDTSESVVSTTQSQTATEASQA